MADDGLGRFEAVLGAISKITLGDEGAGDQLTGVRCPKCNGSSFVKISNLYDEAVRVADEEGVESPAARATGMTDRQILEKFSPPQRRSPVTGAIVFAVPLAIVSFLMYRRFGSGIGQLCGGVSLVATVIFLLTRARKLSDGYYDARRQWNKTYMCNNCRQLVSP